LKKIFIIEDDADTIDIIEFVLRDNGYAVIKANRQVPINEFIIISPNLIILDVRLPFALGSDICLELKSNPKTKHIPVILYSASNNLKTIAEKCLADAYIEKPFDLAKLLTIIANMSL